MSFRVGDQVVYRSTFEPGTVAVLPKEPLPFKVGTDFRTTLGVDMADGTRRFAAPDKWLGCEGAVYFDADGVVVP